MDIMYCSIIIIYSFQIIKKNILYSMPPSTPYRGSRSHDHVVVGFTTTYAISAISITTKVVSLNSADGEVYSIQHYVIKFVSDLRQVGVFSGDCGLLHQ